MTKKYGLKKETSVVWSVPRAMFIRQLLWEKGTDDTEMCYWSNYVMGTVSIVCGIKLLSPYLKFKLVGRGPFDPNVPLSLRLYPALFYFTFALAGICGGLVHQFFPHTNDFPGTPIGWEILWRVTVIMTGFSGAALIITALNVFATTVKTGPSYYLSQVGNLRWKLKLCGVFFATVLCLVNTFWGGVTANGTSFYFTAFSFVCGPLAILFTGLISQISWTRLSLPVDRGTVLMYSAVGAIFIMGTLVQVYFGKWCGFPNAKADYGCPLPDFFNHNVVMHIIQTIGCYIFLHVIRRHLRKYREFVYTVSPTSSSTPSKTDWVLYCF